MILLNFSHPLTPEQTARVEALAGQPLGREMRVPVQFDAGQPFAAQVEALLDALPLAPADWQTEALLVVLPSLNFIAAVLLADLHGRMGYFPAILRLRPVEGVTPPRFEAAEIINLQAVRQAARGRRSAKES